MFRHCYSHPHTLSIIDVYEDGCWFKIKVEHSFLFFFENHLELLLVNHPKIGEGSICFWHERINEGIDELELSIEIEKAI